MTQSIRAFFLCLGALLLVGVSDVKNLHAAVPAKGTLLAASAQVTDPRFRGSVVLLIRHDVHGTVGLVVNRASRLPLVKVLPQGSKLALQGKTVSYGGPVDPQGLLALVKIDGQPPEPAEEIVDGLYVTGVDVLNEWPDFKKQVLDFRIFSGYASWVFDQLEIEMNRGDWTVLPTDEQGVPVVDGAQLWDRLQKKLTELD